MAGSTNGGVIDFNSQVDILTNSSSISERELQLQDCTFKNVTAANGRKSIYIYISTKIHIYNTDINNNEVTSSDVGSSCIYQNSLCVDTVTVITGTAGNDEFLCFADSETLIIRNFEYGSCSTGNNDGKMYLEIKNSEFINYILNNAQAYSNGVIMNEYYFDSILKCIAPKMTDIDITNILGRNNAFIILNDSLLTQQLRVHTPDVSDTWLIRQRTYSFDFDSNILRSCQVYFIHNGVFVSDNVINNDSIILNIIHYTHVNDTVLVVTHIIEYNYSSTVFSNNNYTSHHVNYFNFDLFINFVSVFDETHSLSDFGVSLCIDMQSLEIRHNTEYTLIQLEYDSLNDDQLTVQLNILFDDETMIETILYADATINNCIIQDSKYSTLCTSLLITLVYRNSGIQHYIFNALSAEKSGSNAYLYNSAYVNDLELSNAIVHSQHSSTMFGHINFNIQKECTIINIIGNETVDFETYNWQESSINDSYADGLLVFRNVSIVSNNLDADGHLLFTFKNNNCISRGLMISITLHETHDECMYFQDLSIIVTNVVFSDNQGSFIVNMDRNDKSIDTEKIESQNLFIGSLVLSNDIGNTFLFVSNLSFNDSVSTINCEFDSFKLECIAYIISALDVTANGVGNLTFRNLINNIAHNCSKCALMLTSDNDESTGFVDDSDGDVEFSSFVTNSKFDATVINGYFGSLKRALDADNVIRFEDNVFIKCDTSYANDCVFNLDTADTTLSAYFDNNLWLNIDVIQMISRNGSLLMYHYHMDLIVDVNYINATNSLHICWNNMIYYDLGSSLLINCIESA